LIEGVLEASVEQSVARGASGLKRRALLPGSRGRENARLGETTMPAAAAAASRIASVIACAAITSRPSAAQSAALAIMRIATAATDCAESLGEHHDFKGWFAGLPR